MLFRGLKFDVPNYGYQSQIHQNSLNTSCSIDLNVIEFVDDKSSIRDFNYMDRIHVVESMETQSSSSKILKLLDTLAQEINWKEIILVTLSSHENEMLKIDELENNLHSSTNIVSYILHVVNNRSEAFITQNVISFFHKVNDRNRELKIIIIGDVQFTSLCLKVANTFDVIANQQGYFTYQHKWITLLNEKSHLDEVIHSVENVTNLLAVTTKESTNSFKIFNAFWGIHGRYFDRIGSFIFQGTSSNLCLNTDTLFPNTLYGFNGRHFYIGTNYWRGFTEEITINNRTELQGVSIQKAKALSQYLNFTFTIVFPQDGAWGSFKDGRWNGLVAMAANREVYYLL